ncbi:MAG: SufD family Fe-S cluster assembly protein, partial [Erysipelotrichia bacterium]|nr:SufD family Fe-S cluster assembly protein [Erysipelotrichia bacterium]
MLINELNTKIPKKSEEEFLKINFDSLFSYDFKEVKTYELDIMGLKTIKDENSYESVLFNITKSLDDNQKVLTINKNIA